MRKAISVVNYVFVITMVTAALVAMNVYLKRSLQARVKDLSDAIIGKQYITQLNETESESTATQKSYAQEVYKHAGARHVRSVQTSVTNIKSVVYDDPEKTPTAGTRASAQRVKRIENPQYPNNPN